MSEAVNKSFYAWLNARKENNFSVFQPYLQQIVDFKKQEADLLGYDKHPYDALMNDYDKGLNTSITDELFASLKPELLLLLNKIKNASQVESGFLNQSFDKKIQWNLGIEMLKMEFRD